MNKKINGLFSISALFKMKGFCIGVFIMVFLPFPGFGQNNSTLRILVNSSDDGGPIAGANIRLLNPENDTPLYNGVSNNYGLHEFSNIPSGKYILQISFIGYDTYREPINLENNEVTVQRVSLSIRTEDLGGLVVEAEREITTGEAGIEKISKADIAHVPTAGAEGDLASYLQTVPGVISTGDRGGELYIRGGKPSQNKVLVDGLPVVKPFHISNLYSAFPEQVVQSADLYAGGFGAEFMDATSAIIDVNLRPGNFKQTTGGGSVSPYLASFQLEGPIGNGDESFLIMGRKSLIEDSSPFLYGEDNAIDFYDFLGRYTLQRDAFTCSATGMITYDSGGLNAKRNIGVSWRNIALGGRCLGYAESFNHPIEVTTGYTYFNNEESSTLQNKLSSALSQYFLEVNLGENISEIPLNYGFRLNFRNFKSRFNQRFLQIEDFSDKQAVVSGYISSTIDLSSHLTVEPSFGILGTIETQVTLEPRLRIAYQPAGNGNSEVSLAGGRYTQTMTGLGDLREPASVFKVWRPIDEDLTLPTATHAILAYKQRLGDYFKVNLEGYAKKYQNLSVAKWNIEASLETETALAQGTAYGGDIKLEFDKAPFYFLLSYGYANVEYEAESDALGAWYGNEIFSYHPAHDQRHKINSILSYQFGEYTANASWEFGSGQPYTQIFGYDLVPDVTEEDFYENSGMPRILFDRPYGGRLPVYHRLDVAIERSFVLSPTVTLDTKAGAINLYDRDNLFYFNIRTLQRVNQSGFLPYLSLRAHFE